MQRYKKSILVYLKQWISVYNAYCSIIVYVVQYIAL